jgi:hypothetical protein
MRSSVVLVLSLALVGAAPALADDVTILRGASAPPPAAAPPPLVVQTVVVPEVVYVPTYYPAFGFFPGYFVQDRRFFRPQMSVSGLSSHSHTK